MENKRLSIVECPRDAMQGIEKFIPTEVKVNYLNTLLAVGFDILDFGSFVSPKAIPQMRDTAEVLEKIDESETRLLAIVANERGARDACSFERITYLGYPFSVSPTFQLRNTNASPEESLKRVEAMHKACEEAGKTLLVYLSMAFGNPYNDRWSAEVVIEYAEKIAALGVKEMALADTIGIASPENIKELFTNLIPALPQVTFGAHFHTTPNTWEEKLKAAWNAGCRRFDGAIKGFGGCPMAADELTGNMPTEKILAFCEQENIHHSVSQPAFNKALAEAVSVFPS